jgi:hypothetical protein
MGPAFCWLEWVAGEGSPWPGCGFAKGLGETKGLVDILTQRIREDPVLLGLSFGLIIFDGWNAS